MPAFAIVQRSEQDPLIEIDRRPWGRKRTEQAEHPGAAADLRGARCATLDMPSQASGISRTELVEQECIDERTGACAVQGVANVRVRHITYMTGPGQKVAGTFREQRNGSEAIAGLVAPNGPSARPGDGHFGQGPPIPRGSWGPR